MKVAFCASLVVLVFLGQGTTKHPSPVERSLGGLTVGVSTLDDAKRQFGHSIAMANGEYVVQFDHCRLVFTLEDAPKRQDSQRISAVSLERLSLEHGKAGDCDKLSTGRGLKLSDSFEKVRAIYGKPRQDFIRSGLRVLGYDNRAWCSDPEKKNIRFYGLGIEWSETQKRLVNIHIDVANTECDELR